MSGKKNLNLSVKEIWYKQIEKEVKKIEFREMKNDYWMKKLVVLDHPDYRKYGGDIDRIRTAIVDGDVELHPQDYYSATFWCQGRNMKFRIRSIKAYKNHTTFAIFLGDRLDNGNK